MGAVIFPAGRTGWVGVILSPRVMLCNIESQERLEDYLFYSVHVGFC